MVRGSAIVPTSPPPVEMLPEKESESGDDDVKESGVVVEGGVSVIDKSVAFDALQQINDKSALVSIRCSCSKLAVVLLQPLCSGALLRQRSRHRHCACMQLQP